MKILRGVKERGGEMIGIKSYGAYIPRYRIDRNVIYSAMGWLNPAIYMAGEKAVANWDEDSISMAVAAAIDCLNGMERGKIDGLYLATTTPPYMLRQNSGIVAGALDLRSEIRTADFAGSTKSGTSGLLSALDAIKGGGAGNVLICASDCRTSKPGSAQEHLYGDGAAALLLGNEGVIATLEGHCSVSYDFPDRWRANDERFEHAWEDRFIRDEGYGKFMIEAMSGLLKKYNLTIKDFAKVVYPCLYPREHAAIARRIGAEPGQIQDSMLPTVGDTGSASPLMMLVAALEEARPGDKILVASFGSGSDALFFQVTEGIGEARARRAVKKHLASKKELPSYERYLAFRNIIPMEIGMRGEETATTSMSLLFRDRKMVLSLCGSKCKRCGTPQYPYQRVCVNPDCGSVDEMEYYRFSGKKGTLFTYTGDNLAASTDPPAIYGLIDFEGGGRFWFDLTDCDLEAVKVDMPVEMTFRRKYMDEARGVHGYFWKATPIRA
ncbi:OB-fold domain-containing protein [Dehalococcoidia bacterium]|nr:OB-fold domain-containing protein [Dehalococcoidia bacterium]